MEVDDRIERASPAQIAGAGMGVVLLAAAGTWWAPPVLDLVLVAASVGGIVAAGWAELRRRALLEQPLELAAAAARGDDDRVRVRMWLGRGRSMRDVRLTVTSGDREAQVGAAGPVVGPWTGVVDLPGDSLRVAGRCSSGGRAWVVEAELPVEHGRYAPPVAGVPGSLCWARPAWGTIVPQAHREAAG